ncbi:MAG: hypothetical protein M9899_01550 [Bdellovibrionaceae bacterium]|nr:hypothetical protein [Pseudobdellovibrionaceae bacterium]
MKLITITVAILFSSQISFAALTANTPNCDKQAKQDRHVSVSTCNFNFSSLYPSCAGKVKESPDGARGADYSQKKGS